MQLKGPGAFCGSGFPAWAGLGNPPLSRGIKYSCGSGFPNGITKVLLKPSDAAQAKILAKGGGHNLPFVAGSGALPLPLRVQLRAENGHCWDAVYATATVNTGTSFKARSE